MVEQIVACDMNRLHVHVYLELCKPFAVLDFMFKGILFSFDLSQF